MTSVTKGAEDLTRQARRDAKQRKRLDQIVTAAALLFVEKGYEETSVQDIAEAVGVLKGSLYYYITAKEDLLFWAMQRNHERLYDFVVRSLDTSDLAPIDQTAWFVDRHVAFTLTNQENSALYAHDFRVLSRERRAEIISLRRRYENAFVRLVTLAQGETRKAGPGSDPKLIGRALLSMCNAAPQWYRPDGPFDLDAIREHYVEIAVRAVR